MNRFSNTLLREVLQDKGYIRGPFGSALLRSELISTGIPVYEQQHAIRGIREFRFFIGDEKYIELKRFSTSPGDLIISCSGTVGEISMITKDDPLGIISQALLILRTDPEVMIPEFLRYYLITRQGKHAITTASHGSVQVNIAPRKVVENIELPLPTIIEQKTISNILGTLDRKIELNKKNNMTFEDIAKSLFKSWFVDFDPVKAKSEGRSTGLPDEISDLFPDSFENSELGKIPLGWKIISLKEMLETISETYSIKNKKEVVFLNTGDIESGKFLTSSYSSTKGLPGQAKKSIVKGDILFSEIRPKNNRHAYVYFDASDYVVSTKLMVLRSRFRENSLFEYFLITQKSSINYLQLLAESRSGTFPQITFSELNAIQFALPKNNHLINFFTNNFLDSIYSKSQNIKEYNKNLEEIRDTFLPKLISGELRIPDAEKMIEEVGI